MRYVGKDIQDINFESWLKHKPPVLQPIGLKWFSAIKNCGADVLDIFHDGYPIGCVDHAPFAYVNIFPAHVNVGFFYGAHLPDPNRLLEGQGKRMRHIKVRAGSAIDEEAIQGLIDSAYADIKLRLKMESESG